jgi:hypothetical protein
VEIEFERSGGFAGIVLRSTLNTDKLIPEDRQQIESLISKSAFFSLKSDTNTDSVSAGGRRPADYLTYKITIRDGKKIQSVQTTDLTKNIELKKFVDYLSKKALQNPNQ